MSAFNIKTELAKLYKSRCYVCHKKFGKRFAFHHLWYIDNDVIHRNYKGNSEKYHKDLKPLILDNPKRFMLLCNTHHHYITWGAKFKDIKKWNRYLKAVRMSR